LKRSAPKAYGTSAPTCSKTRAVPPPVYAQQVDDPEQARQAFAASRLPIDLQHKQVMAEVHEGPAEVELLFDIRAEGE
jgi:hypothetical protein